MTEAERDAVREILNDAHTVALKALIRANESGELNPTLLSLAVTHLDSSFKVAAVALDTSKVSAS